PTLFNGTVRYNLDPLCQHTDQEIWEVLGKCQLKDAVQDKTGGLDSIDTMLQETIRSEFADCTVITVAHRIPTVMDCTMVLTMSDGKIAEYDEPMKLMRRDDSLFGQLVKEYWILSYKNKTSEMYIEVRKA
nr:ABC transporter C family member 10-like [Tanacetum cinerariifolium]